MEQQIKNTIIDMITQINDIEILIAIYTFIKFYLKAGGK